MWDVGRGTGSVNLYLYTNHFPYYGQRIYLFNYLKKKTYFHHNKFLIWSRKNHMTLVSIYICLLTLANFHDYLVPPSYSLILRSYDFIEIY